MVNVHPSIAVSTCQLGIEYWLGDLSVWGKACFPNTNKHGLPTTHPMGIHANRCNSCLQCRCFRCMTSIPSPNSIYPIRNVTHMTPINKCVMMHNPNDSPQYTI